MVGLGWDEPGITASSDGPHGWVGSDGYAMAELGWGDSSMTAIIDVANDLQHSPAASSCFNSFSLRFWISLEGSEDEDGGGGPEGFEDVDDDGVDSAIFADGSTVFATDDGAVDVTALTAFADDGGGAVDSAVFAAKLCRCLFASMRSCTMNRSRGGIVLSPHKSLAA